MVLTTTAMYGCVFLERTAKLPGLKLVSHEMVPSRMSGCHLISLYNHKNGVPSKKTDPYMGLSFWLLAWHPVWLFVVFFFGQTPVFGRICPYGHICFRSFA